MNGATRRSPRAGENPPPKSTAHNELVTASPLKLRLAEIIASDKSGRILGVLSRKRVRHHGLWIDVRSNDFSPRVRAQIFWGMYEGAETRMIRGLLRGSTCVVELGSSLGVTTAHVVDLMAPGGHLVCVEANPHLVPGLCERIRSRSATLQVDIIHAAVTNHCGTTALTLSPQTASSRLVAAAPNEATVQVPALTLREILRRTGVAEFDLISDIEGAETAFLLQDPGVLGGCRRAVIELHDTTVGSNKVSVYDLMQATVAAGFQLASRHGPVLALTRS